MPALEIMPQCATMEEAQRRANIHRGIVGLPHISPPLENKDDEDHHHNSNIKNTSTSQTSQTSQTSPKSSSGRRIARFVKRNLRGLRRRSYPPYQATSDDARSRDECDNAHYKQDHDQTGPSRATSTTGRPQPIGDETKKEPKVEVKNSEFRGKSNTNAGFSPIAVRYWPKIMEDEEEEPPEALQFDHDSWGLSNQGTK